MGTSINMMGHNRFRGALAKFSPIRFVWLSLLGLLLILAGWLAIIFPDTIIERYLVLIFVIGAGSRFMGAISARSRRIASLGLVGCAVYLAGAYAVGAISTESSRVLGEVIAVFLIINAAVDLLLAFVDEYMIRSGWLFNGLLSLTLAALILREWPSGEIWAVGVLLGFWLVLDGWAVISQGSTDYAIEKGASGA